jgi:hypothetical protein
MRLASFRCLDGTICPLEGDAFEIGQDERGEVRVVVMRAGPQQALAGLDTDLHESRAAALIALTGGLAGYRRDVI